MTRAVSPRGLLPIEDASPSNGLSRILDTMECCIPILGMQGERSDSQAFRREKFACETALVLYAAFRSSDDRQLHDRCRELGRMLVHVARGEEVVTLMTLRPAMIQELSVAHVCLSQIGLHDAAFDQVIAGLLEFGCKPSERLPWKDLEAAWLASMHDAFSAPEALDTSLARTTLAVGFDCLAASRIEMYAFTHAAMYLTDFGHKPVRPPRDLTLILRDAEGALVRCMDDDDFDLAAELLMTWPLFGVPMSPTAEFCLQVLVGVEEAVGFLPSLSVNPGQLGQLAPEQRTRKLLDEAYHTIYVMGLLYAALTRAAGAGDEPEAEDELPVAPAASMPLPPRVRDGQPMHPQWEQYHARLSGAEQARLGSFVVGVALSRALQRSDLAGVRRILVDDLDGGARYAPGGENAGEIIARLAQLA